MPRVSKKNASANTTAELIAAKEEEIRELDRQLAEIKTARKNAEGELAKLNDQLKYEKLNDIGLLAEKAGVSVDVLLNALNDGSILARIKEDSKTETKKEESNEEMFKPSSTETFSAFSNSSNSSSSDEVFSASGNNGNSNSWSK